MTTTAFAMKYMMVAAVSLLLVIVCAVKGSDTADSPPSSLRDKRSLSTIDALSHLDDETVDREILPLLVKIFRERLHDLRNKRQPELMEDIPKAYVSKRKAFWQPMSGPLPVETRLASFGSRIEPEGDSSHRIGVLKTMRYGRKRRSSH